MNTPLSPSGLRPLASHAPLAGDACHFFCFNTQPLAPRLELWLSALGVLAASLCWLVLAFFMAANLESEETALLWACGMPIGVSIITALFLYPATIRRARCFGSPVLGYLAVAFNGVGAFGLCVVFCCGVCEIELSEASFTLYGILLLFYPVSLALFLILLCAGGLYSGRKRELMRAAICGDLLRVRQLLAQDPDGVFTLSETGRSARQYAEMADQPGIARLLADHEALAAERAEQEQG